jgi:hypothetical protein
MDTGMLDMSAFGDFGDFGGAADDDDWGDQPQPQQQQQQQPPADAATGSSGNPLETGMLDMSAFGDFGGVQQQHQQQQPAAASHADAMASGLLDMSAFGFGADMGHEPEADAQQQQQRGSEVTSAETSLLQQQQQQADQCDRAHLHQGLAPGLLAKTLVQFPPPPKQTAVRPGVLGITAPTAAAAAVNAPAQQLLLSRAEVRELHSVLGLPEAQKQLAAGHSSSSSSRGGTSGASSSAQAYYSRLLGAAGAAEDTRHGGYTRSSSSTGQGSSSEAAAAAAANHRQQQQQQQQGDTEVLLLLGLNPSQGQQLCNVAAALSTRTFFGEAGEAADDADYAGPITSSENRITSSSTPANAAELAASWAAGGADSSSSSSSNRWPGLSRSSSSAVPAAAADGSSGTAAAAALAVIGVPDGGFNAALFQEVDPAGRLFSVNVQSALLQLAGHVAAGPSAAAAAASGQQERDHRFSAAVARLFQPVSVSRNQAVQSRKGAALLSHYPAMPTPSAAAALPPLSPGRQQQQQQLHGGRAAGSSYSSLHQGLRAGGSSALGFSRTGSRQGLAMRSSMSVVSMLSFSSLKADTASVDGGGSSGGAAAAAAAAAAQAGSSTWAAFMGLLPGVTPLLCLWALTSSSQGSLLQVLLPLVPDDIEVQLAAVGVRVAAMAAGGHHHKGGSSQGGGGSFVAGHGQEQQGELDTQ